jgi:hypothetical protein
MIEITIPLLLDVIRTIGILVGIFYYITIMRNADKVRRTQLVSNISNKWWSVEFETIAIDILEMSWTDSRARGLGPNFLSPEKCIGKMVEY